jgi:hypothetical protein
MRYMMLIYTDGAAAPGPSPDLREWARSADETGLSHQGIRLRPATEGRIVRVRNGEMLVTEGPFSEAAEQVMGVELVDCADLDEVIAAAAEHPASRGGAIDIRPFLEV